MSVFSELVGIVDEDMTFLMSRMRSQDRMMSINT